MQIQDITIRTHLQSGDLVPFLVFAGSVTAYVLICVALARALAPAASDWRRRASRSAGVIGCPSRIHRVGACSSRRSSRASAAVEGREHRWCMAAPATLTADSPAAASCAKRNQKVPQGYYNLEVMLRNVERHGGEIGVCGSCMDARGLGDDQVVEGARRSTLQQLADWTAAADKVLVF